MGGEGDLENNNIYNIYFLRRVEEREREVDRRGRKNMIIFINIYFLWRVEEREDLPRGAASGGARGGAKIYFPTLTSTSI